MDLICSVVHALMRQIINCLMLIMRVQTRQISIYGVQIAVPLKDVGQQWLSMLEPFQTTTTCKDSFQMFCDELDPHLTTHLSLSKSF